MHALNSYYYCVYVGSCARPHGAWTFCADVASSAGTLISADAHGFRSGKVKRVEAEHSRQPLRHCTDQTDEMFLAGILKGSARDIRVAFKKGKEEKSLVLATRNQGSSEKGLSRTHAVTTYKDTEEWHI